MSQRPGPEQISQALRLASRGDRSALDRLLPAVYEELRAIARMVMNQERPGHTLQGTAVVHEAYMRLLGQEKLNYADRGQFFAAAANTIRRILVDHARSKGRQKRGGGGAWERVSLDGADLVDGRAEIDLIMLNDALEKLAELSPRGARVVELRFFGGLSVDEAAAAMDVPPRTAADDWALARAWLRRELEGGDAGIGAGRL
jgi:RNA polymerase sigma-70 factor (ECF subfamily)